MTRRPAPAEIESVVTAMIALVPQKTKRPNWAMIREVLEKGAAK